MNLNASRPTSVVQPGFCPDKSAQELEDWTAEIALTVAGTLEPSCALAFCFGHRQSLLERQAAESLASREVPKAG